MGEELDSGRSRKGVTGYTKYVQDSDQVSTRDLVFITKHLTTGENKRIRAEQERKLPSPYLVLGEQGFCLFVQEKRANQRFSSVWYMKFQFLSDLMPNEKER